VQKRDGGCSRATTHLADAEWRIGTKGITVSAQHRVTDGFCVMRLEDLDRREPCTL